MTPFSCHKSWFICFLHVERLHISTAVWQTSSVQQHHSSCRSQINIWDVGGQKSLRSYWRNYFEQTDALIWVVDSADTWRLEDCKSELHNLLKEERLAGATLLVLANKQDQLSAKTAQQIQEVCSEVLFLDYLWPAMQTLFGWLSKWVAVLCCSTSERFLLRLDQNWSAHLSLTNSVCIEFCAWKTFACER